MKISSKSWGDFVTALAKINDKAAAEALHYYRDTYLVSRDRKALINYAFGLATKYGEAASALAATYYDAISAASHAAVAAAEPAATATIAEVAEAVNGGLQFSENENFISHTIARLVKQAGADTMVKNARRDRAEYAWIPSGGETCPLCLALAANGWQPATQKTASGDHASHIHANCQCMFAVRFVRDTEVAGYDPQKYERKYASAEGDNSAQRINYLRRQNYRQNKETILAQQREAYAIRVAEREKSSETT